MKKILTILFLFCWGVAASQTYTSIQSRNRISQSGNVIVFNIYGSELAASGRTNVYLVLAAPVNIKVNWGDGITDDYGLVSDYFNIGAYTYDHFYPRIDNWIITIIVSDISKVTEIGFEYVTNMTNVNLGFLKNITTASFFQNDILTSLDISNSPNLANAFIYSNQTLSSLNLSNCSSLLGLVCNYNQLVSLNLSDCTNLINLDCTANPISSLDLSDSQNLDLNNLNMPGNMEYLNISNNNTIHLYSHNYGIDTLICENSKLESTENLYTFKYFDGSNSINLIDIDNFSGSYLLSHIDLSKCTSLYNFHFNEMLSLSYLNLDSCVSLLYIYLVNSYTTPEIFNISINNCIALQGVQFQHFKLPKLDFNDFVNINSISGLVIQNCQTDSLNVSNLTNLTGLYCPENNLTSLDVSGLTSLLTLDCNYNQLTSLSINDILSSLVSNNLNNGTFTSYSQTPPAPPTGQGITDTAILISRGWSVITD